ncbi:hypothetical protein, partial [uncultured Gemmiger sp.]|uniref:hypothetical protein n=1 Tax=uncultured Gemmiger sp. TaxID=1623490 RepID=UPI0025DB46D1
NFPQSILKWTDTNYVCPFCIGFVSGRIFKTPVHRHFDGILRDAPHPLGSPTFYHAPAKISNKLAKLQNFVHNCKKRPGA